MGNAIDIVVCGCMSVGVASYRSYPANGRTGSCSNCMVNEGAGRLEVGRRRWTTPKGSLPGDTNHRRGNERTIYGASVILDCMV